MCVISINAKSARNFSVKCKVSRYDYDRGVNSCAFEAVVRARVSLARTPRGCTLDTGESWSASLYRRSPRWTNSLSCFSLSFSFSFSVYIYIFIIFLTLFFNLILYVCIYIYIYYYIYYFICMYIYIYYFYKFL